MGKGSGSGGGAVIDSMPRTVGVSKRRIAPVSLPIEPKGLKNVGNTCYANAALQCLLSTALSHALLEPEKAAIFRRFSSNPNLLKDESVREASGQMSSEEKSKQKKEQKKMHESSQWLRKELTIITREYTMLRVPASPASSMLSGFLSSPADTQTVNPGNITKHPHKLSKCLTPYQQEDAHEFMRALLSTLTMNGQNKQLSSLFDGLLESAVTCQICGHASFTRDRYMDLSLDISRANSLQDALEEFTHSEFLDGDNSVTCEKCARKQPVTKGLRLATAPSILVCHLKRFAFDQYGRMIRLAKHVSFPEKLEIQDYMSRVNQAKPPPYKLVGVLVHQGRSCDCGHYLAYVKSGNSWYKANDSQVSRVDPEVVMRQQAYILMYEVAGMRDNPYHHRVHPSSCPTAAPKNPFFPAGTCSARTPKEDALKEAPKFDASRAPDAQNTTTSLLTLLCGVSEANEAIIQDFCCGVGLSVDPMGTEPVEVLVQNRNSTSLRTFAESDCDRTIGESTLGESTVATTDSHRSCLKKSSSVTNLRDFENRASKSKLSKRSRKRRSQSVSKVRGTPESRLSEPLRKHKGRSRSAHQRTSRIQ